MKRLLKFGKTTLILFLVFTTHLFSQTSGFTVPQGHPRLWWNADRLAKAKVWYAQNTFTPPGDDPFNCALRYVLTGESTYARKAIDWLVALNLPADEVLPTAIGCDQCRWYGEIAVVVFDWCYDQMTDSERSTIITKWNKYFSDVNQQDWGGVGMEGNNYYWGNLRNSVEWGIASFYHNTSAQSFLDNGLKTRWKNSFIPYADTSTSKGGGLGEGPEYGCTMLDYPIIPFVSAGLMGRNVYEESNFYKEALANIIYSTTPAPLVRGNDQFYLFFPYNESDVEDFLHEREYFGNFMTVAANQWKEVPLGQYAKKWLNLTAANIDKYVQSVDVTTITAKDLNTLPLDYYASGLGILSARTAWTTDATAIQIQLKDAAGVGHAHKDWSSFQMFRKGHWLTRETSGYSDQIIGVNSGTNIDTDVSEADAHNTIFIGKSGDMKSLTGSWQLGKPQVTRLESTSNYVYASLDLSNCFKTSRPDVASLLNPFVENVVREYIFIRPLETLVIFDRLKSKASGSTTAADVIKTALIHFETNPKLEDANHALVTIGGQTLRLTTLVPSNPTYEVVNEAGTVGQYRLQVSTQGADQSYLVNILQGRDETGINLTTNVDETASAFNITITHPNLGNAVLNLEKGALSTGGKIGFSVSQIPAQLTSFTTGVAQVSVTNNGVFWGTEGDTISPTAIEPGISQGNALALKIQPNPVSGNAVISFNLNPKSTGALKLSLFSADGQLNQSWIHTVENPGLQTSVFNGEKLPDGLYFLQIQTEYGSQSIRVLLQR